MTGTGRQISLRVDDPSQIATARRAASDLAHKIGFDETYIGKAALLVTEAATNLLKHANGGEILMRDLSRGMQSLGASGIEILVIDKGPGIASLHQSMADGVSTAGTSGTGLGAMQRIASTFDIFTAPNKGTVICMRLWPANHAAAGAPVDIGVVCIPMPGEEACGDAWAVAADKAGCSVMVADGLGHGPLAAAASEPAVAMLATHSQYSPAQLLEATHGALRGTRGAAVAAGRLAYATSTFHFAGVGNIATMVLQAQGRKQLMSHNGIVGGNMRKTQEFSVAWQDHDLLIMHSDGLSTQWSVDGYPGLLVADPAIIAAVLYRDYWRRRDDVTVLVMRYSR
ncbi:anti-sigma regulatory factor (Ser/Thr protein kinase) [Paucimonas lemoignei]|uniref:Anti-sigma regulatory factor (Ser/Thr protein kinase) n=1 Tax=Paucimonas lemoignei TaxID=29443 RepID=A0A4R3HU42_PAULE|nr:ATP-binding SpoIIE family protein phosphatase [Paucimonas lemoignei]TCS35183.1 anti-sigma regulatory factor (Ser/Thr protein kinase) [Paucimonas lemoignei]